MLSSRVGLNVHIKNSNIAAAEKRKQDKKGYCLQAGKTLINFDDLYIHTTLGKNRVFLWPLSKVCFVSNKLQ